MRTRILSGLTLLLLAVPCFARAFSVQPSLIDVQVGAGKSIASKITVVNPDLGVQTYFLSAGRFETQDNSGIPVFPSGADAYGEGTWIHFPSSSVTVPAKGKMDVPISIDVPDGTKPGEYDAAVFVSPAPSDVVSSVNGASVQAKVAVLLFIDVGGNGVEKVGLLDFSMTNGAVWQDGLWGMYAFRLQNQGNVHVVPKGSVEIRDVFGRIISEGDANPSGARIVPQATRTFQGIVGSAAPRTFWQAVRLEAAHFALGPVTFRVQLTPGLAPGQPLSSQFRLWILPWQLGLVVLAGVALLYGLMRLLMRSKQTDRA